MIFTYLINVVILVDQPVVSSRRSALFTPEGIPAFDPTSIPVLAATAIRCPAASLTASAINPPSSIFAGSFVFTLIGL